MKGTKTITICSSASFYQQVLEIEKDLKKLGFKVNIPKTANIMKRKKDFDVTHYKTWFKDQNDYKKKTALINAHFKKVLEADAILVVNLEKKGINGYIGGNGLMEMTVAYLNKKPIFVLNNVDSTSPFEEEIKGLHPVFIQQDLSKIKIR